MATKRRPRGRLKWVPWTVLGLGLLGSGYGIYQAARSRNRKREKASTLVTDISTTTTTTAGTGSGAPKHDVLLTPRPAGIPSVSELKDPKWITEGLRKVERAFGTEIARNVERIYTQETGFRSGQYQNSGSAGMATWSDTFPYSWKSLEDFWRSNPEYAPVDKITYAIARENGKHWSYLAFPKYGGFMTLGKILELRGNDPGRYASSDPNSDYANWYRNKIQSINTKYI